MKRRKALGVLAGLAAGALYFSASGIMSYALPGWDNSSGEWKYNNAQEESMTNVWRQSGPRWYYLGSDGKLLKDSLLSWQNDTYYLDKDGVMAVNQWVHISGEQSSDQGSFAEGWYYFGPTGKSYRKTGDKFKKIIDGKSYVFNEDGVMLTGWLDENGGIVDDDDPFVQGVYYGGDDGALVTDGWYHYADKLVPFTGSDTKSQLVDRDYYQYKDMWFYFDEKGKKVASTDGKIKEKTVKGITYGFDENGVMDPWWGSVASVSTLRRSNPTSDVPVKFYSGYNGGELFKDRWFWMYPSEQLDEQDYQDQESSWWRAGSNGKVLRNKIFNINGKRYAFDGIGRMKTGFVLFDKRREFVAQYDVDSWESENFINGDLYGIERADLYFFNVDEWNDGSMQTGKNIKIKLDDGEHTFGFAANGKAYGNRNILEKVGNRYYINGLLFQANPEYRYGVVKVSNSEYRVINSAGNLMKGTRKALSLGEGEYLLIVDDKLVGYATDQSRAPKWMKGDRGEGFYGYNENQTDHYAGGYLAGARSTTDLSYLPEEMKLNFKDE